MPLTDVYAQTVISLNFLPAVRQESQDRHLKEVYSKRRWKVESNWSTYVCKRKSELLMVGQDYLLFHYSYINFVK